MLLRLDQQMEVNTLLGDHLQQSRELTVDTVLRIEESIQRLEVNLNKDYLDLRSELDRVKVIVTDISGQVEQESQSLQEQGLQGSQGLQRLVAEETLKLREDFDEQLRASSHQVAGALKQLEKQTLQCNEGAAWKS